MDESTSMDQEAAAVTPPQSFGVPYAERVQEGGSWYSICPVCDERIELFHWKDFESYSGIEYARHYQRQHEEALRG